MGIRSMIQSGLWPSMGKEFGLGGERDPLLKTGNVAILFQPTPNDTGILEVAGGLAVGIIGDTKLTGYMGVAGQKVITLDGNADWLEASDRPSYTIGAKTFALETRVIFSKPGYQIICGQWGGDTDVTNSSFLLYKDDQERIIWKHMASGLVTLGNTNFNSQVGLGLEYHIAVARTPGTPQLCMYVNGTRVQTADLGAWTMTDSNRMFKIGSSDAPDASTGYLYAKVQGLRLTVADYRGMGALTIKVPKRFPVKG